MVSLSDFKIKQFVLAATIFDRTKIKLNYKFIVITRCDSKMRRLHKGFPEDMNVATIDSDFIRNRKTFFKFFLIWLCHFWWTMSILQNIVGKKSRDLKTFFTKFLSKLDKLFHIFLWCQEPENALITIQIFLFPISFTKVFFFSLSVSWVDHSSSNRGWILGWSTLDFFRIKISRKKG